MKNLVKKLMNMHATGKSSRIERNLDQPLVNDRYNHLHDILCFIKSILPFVPASSSFQSPARVHDQGSTEVRELLIIHQLPVEKKEKKRSSKAINLNAFDRSNSKRDTRRIY